VSNNDIWIYSARHNSLHRDSSIEKSFIRSYRNLWYSTDCVFCLVVDEKNGFDSSNLNWKSLKSLMLEDYKNIIKSEGIKNET